MPERKVPLLLLILFSLILLVVIGEGIYYFYLQRQTSSESEVATAKVALEEKSEEENQLVLEITEKILGFIEEGDLEGALPHFIYGEPDSISQEETKGLLSLIEENYKQEGVFYPYEISVSGAIDDKGLSVVRFSIKEEQSEIVFGFLKMDGDWKIKSISFQGKFLME